MLGGGGGKQVGVLRHTVGMFYNTVIIIIIIISGGKWGGGGGGGAYRNVKKQINPGSKFNTPCDKSKAA